MFSCRTKQLVVEVIRCQHGGDSVPVVLTTPCTPQEEAAHQALMRERERNRTTRSHTPNSKLSRQTSFLAEMTQPLESIKQKIVKNLGELERVGMVHRQNHYQALLNSIVQVTPCLCVYSFEMYLRWLEGQSKGVDAICALIRAVIF